jgi:hypothetical protein
MTTRRRRNQINALREEGSAARRAVRSIKSNPYRELDALHWRAGWIRADSELMAAALPPPRQCPYCGNNLSDL